MTKLNILNITEQVRFDAPPKFRKEDRLLYFALTDDIHRLGQFRKRDINAVAKPLALKVLSI